MTQAEDPGYVAYQYSDAEKYLIRVDTHRDYSEASGSFVDWVIERLAPEPGSMVLDVGCGPGIYHRALHAKGATVVGSDLFDGMLRERGNLAGSTGRAVRATAETMPFRDAAFPRVMANHMLYHAEDQVAALSELRRVLSRGGRAVLATNAAENMRGLHELHTRACDDVGLRSTSDDKPGRFTLDHLEFVRSVFPGVRVDTRIDALVFPDAGPALRYYATFIIDYVTPLPADGSHRAPLLEVMRARIDQVIERDGVLRISKDAGCFVADV